MKIRIYALYPCTYGSLLSCFSLYDQIFCPSKLSGNADFHLFKAGVEPKWEDPECVPAPLEARIARGSASTVIAAPWLDVIRGEDEWSQQDGYAERTIERWFQLNKLRISCRVVATLCYHVLDMCVTHRQTRNVRYHRAKI